MARFRREGRACHDLNWQGAYPAHATQRLRRAPRRYGNSTFTLKNLCAELVDDCHTGSVRFGCVFSPGLVKTETEM